jgi:hypothetical protein
LVKKDKDGNEFPVTKWSSILTVSKAKGGFLHFANQFLFNTYDLMGHEPPRMPISYQQKLQLHPSLRVGDWFCYPHFVDN